MVSLSQSWKKIQMQNLLKKTNRPRNNLKIPWKPEGLSLRTEFHPDHPRDRSSSLQDQLLKNRGLLTEKAQNRNRELLARRLGSRRELAHRDLILLVQARLSLDLTLHPLVILPSLWSQRTCRSQLLKRRLPTKEFNWRCSHLTAIFSNVICSTVSYAG